MDVLKKCFDGFADEEGAIPAENVGNILSLMGLKVKPTALKNIIEEIDEDGKHKSSTNVIYSWFLNRFYDKYLKCIFIHMYYSDIIRIRFIGIR